MNRLINQLRAQALQTQQTTATTRRGTVVSYDPNAYAVKVLIQPDEVLTAWIPLKSAWVGNGWGMFCPPSIGDAVELDFQEGDAGVSCVGWRFYNDQDQPLPCPSGEFWLVHQSGSLLKFHNGGDVELVAAGTLTSSASQWNHKGPLQVSGDVHITGSTTIDSAATVKGSATVKGAIVGQGGMAVSGGSGASVTGSMSISGGDVTVDGLSLKGHHHTAQGSSAPTTAAQA
jgi:phage baseplate assembly protein gpV